MYSVVELQMHALLCTFLTVDINIKYFLLHAKGSTILYTYVCENMNEYIASFQNQLLYISDVCKNSVLQDARNK